MFVLFVCVLCCVCCVCLLLFFAFGGGVPEVEVHVSVHMRMSVGYLKNVNAYCFVCSGPKNKIHFSLQMLTSKKEAFGLLLVIDC